MPRLRKIADGSALRNLRKENAQPQGPILSAAPAVDAPKDGGGGIFGAAAANAEDAKPRSPGRTVADLELTLTGLLKKIALEIAPAKEQEGDAAAMTNLEVLARGMFTDAIAGDKGMREIVVERLEGKAVRAAQVTPPDTTLEEQIGRAEVNALNDLTKEA